MDFRLAIAQQILSALPEAALEAADVASMLEVPPDTKLGDYAFPCFKLSKALRKFPHGLFLLAAAHQQQLPAGVLLNHSRKHPDEVERVFLVVEPPYKPGQTLGSGNAVLGADCRARRGVGVKAGLVHRIAGDGKVRPAVDMVTKHKPARSHAAAQKVICKQLVHQMGGAPGQRHGRVNDMAVHNDLGMGAEHPHHTADGRADFAGSMVMDDIVILMGFQMLVQCADTGFFIVRHRNDMHPGCFQCRRARSLIRRAKADKQIHLVAGKVQIEQKVLHIALHPALHAKVVADHQDLHGYGSFAHLDSGGRFVIT